MRKRLLTVGHLVHPVYLRTDKVGRLWLDAGRRFVFQYAPGWLASDGAAPLWLRLLMQTREQVGAFTASVSHRAPTGQIIGVRLSSETRYPDRRG